MQIRTLTDIVNGELLNSPSISFITQIDTLASKVNDGDLFISNNLNDIHQAIENGAFAVIFSEVSLKKELLNIDNEIAWIKVDCIENALFKLARFILSSKEIKSYSCDEIFFEFLNKLLTNKKNIDLLSNDIFQDFRTLINLEENSYLISSDLQYLQKIQPLSTPIVVSKKKVENVTIKSIFRCSFSYSGYMFNSIKLPYLYINHFLSLIEFIGRTKALETSIDVNSLKNIEFLSPIFIDKNFDIVDFGKSNQFILTNNNGKLYSSQVEYIKQYYNFGNLHIIEEFRNDEDLLSQIKENGFNALYILGKNKKEVIQLLEDSKQEQRDLFA